MTSDSAIEQTCAVCGEQFLTPATERQFRRERGLHDPIECVDCRARLRSVRNAELISMYERVDSVPVGGQRLASGSGQPERGGRPTRQSNVSHQRYNTVCSQCGKETQVPFVPRGDRPVYCRDCFNARRGR